MDNMFDYHRRNVPAGEQHDPLTEVVIGACIEVHKELGPGMPESHYHAALKHELDLRRVSYATEVQVSVTYKGKQIGTMRLDLVVEDQLIVELKACEALAPVHRAQCISYLRATGLKKVLLVNFNVAILRDGIERVVLSS